MSTLSLDKLKVSLDSPIYHGSVQNLHAVPGNDDLIISETTSGGSVFDVGTIYNIAGSDTARTSFRHYIFTKLANPNTWQQARKQIEMFRHFKGEEFPALLENLCENGANTHHLGMLEPDSGKIFKHSFPSNLSNLTLIENFHINKPQLIRYADTSFYDYSSYPGLNSFVIPLEYIVRFGVTSGSSILNIYNSLQGAAKAQYLSELGQTSALKAWTVFDTPINDFTSKYEPSDRSVSKQEAALISSISGELFVESIMLSQLASFVVQHIFAQMGLYLWDLKWEIAKQADTLVFVDTIDTDSVRATLKLEKQNQSLFIHFNKQAMRDYYKIMHADWYVAVNDAKKRATVGHEPFVSILKQGQNDNTYPNTPVVDPRFLEIQGNKFQYITRYVLEDGQSNDYQQQALDIANQEIDFYVGAGQYDQYLYLNAAN
jgi:phosphoribosylaminoimidazole-succinocarboxamide synthase